MLVECKSQSDHFSVYSMHAYIKSSANGLQAAIPQCNPQYLGWCVLVTAPPPSPNTVPTYLAQQVWAGRCHWSVLASWGDCRHHPVGAAAVVSAESAPYCREEHWDSQLCSISTENNYSSHHLTSLLIGKGPTQNHAHRELRSTNNCQNGA